MPGGCAFPPSTTEDIAPIFLGNGHHLADLLLGSAKFSQGILEMAHEPVKELVVDPLISHTLVRSPQVAVVLRVAPERL